MGLSAFQGWLGSAPLWMVALTLFTAMCAAALAGTALQPRRAKEGKPSAGSGGEDGQEGYIVSAVLGLLALLLGFTFSLAVERFDTRRVLVVTEANAIGAAYLQSQLLGEPHRTRMSGLLVRYMDNRIELASATPGPRQTALLAADDALIIEIWAATSAAFDSIKNLDFSSSYVESINEIVELDAARRAARAARVPAEVFAVLFIYMVAGAGVLGYVVRNHRVRIAAGVLLVLLTLSLNLILDIDRPTGGQIVESQLPMQALRKSLVGQPPRVFDRWRTPGAER